MRQTREQVKQAVRVIMTWDFDRGGEYQINKITDALCEGKSVIVDAVSYLGNDHYVSETKRGRYKYKMFVPYMDETGCLYSTDLYSGTHKNAVEAPVGIYRYTRQLVVRIVDIITIERPQLQHGDSEMYAIAIDESRNDVVGASLHDALTANPQSHE